MATSKTTAAPKAASKAAKAATTATKAQTKAPAKKAATATAAAPALETRKAFGSVDKGTPYSAFETHATFSAYTVAALIVSGMVKLSANGTPSKPAGKAFPGLFRMLTGKTAWSHWTKAGRIETGALTAQGLNEIQARLSGQSRGYNTTAETVAAFAETMAKGGETKVNGKVYRFTRETVSSS